MASLPSQRRKVSRIWGPVWGKGASGDSGGAPSPFRFFWDSGPRQPAKSVNDAPWAGGPGKRNSEEPFGEL